MTRCIKCLKRNWRSLSDTEIINECYKVFLVDIEAAQIGAVCSYKWEWCSK